MTIQDKLSITDLEKKSAVLRCEIIEMISHASKGHPGGSLSAADIITALYFRVMRINPDNPDWEDRDRFVLSKGHACPALYSALALRGYFDPSRLITLRQLNSMLQAHPDMKKTPGVDMTTGSLGQGFSAGLGMALAAQYLKKDFHTWVMIGDGEAQEGSIWEAAMAGSKWKLDNLTVIVDWNGLQCDGTLDDKMPMEPFADKWRAFGWIVKEIDGHKMSEIVQALENARDSQRGPTAILAHTIKGKGVSFMENQMKWHGGAISNEQKEIALRDIRKGN